MKNRNVYVFGEHTDYIKECEKMGMKHIIDNDLSNIDSDYQNEIVVVTGANVDLSNIISNIKENREYNDFLCKRNKICDRKFVYGKEIYHVLGINDCYSGWEITVINQSAMDYDSLIDLVKNSREYDEIVGGIGLLLKDYYDRFYAVLVDENILSYKRRRKIAKLILTEIAERSEHVAEMEELLDVCRKIFR